ncbi:MAG TPA: methane monooxygenase/ammonia monooxygenase subunit C [Gammaproteobacteria bacterium]|nr:methane monooxygenase/ammonia monooxygenase subunit C [Gammaproteobacteria bacterium]
MAAVIQQNPEQESANKSGLIARVIASLFFPEDNRGNPTLPWKGTLLLTTMLALFVGAYRWYTHEYSFTVGLDYFDPEFSTYWMSLFWVQITVIGAAFIIGAPWVWFTRPQDPHAAMTPKKELGIYYLILSIFVMAVLGVLVILGLFVEADAAWHQTTIRDTDFTPTHIGLFYLVIPAAAVGLIIGMIWVHTRMPDFIGRISVPFFIGVLAPVMIMPNLGLNEWGHTFFYAEELFAAPIHWGFVVLAWGLFAFAHADEEGLRRVRVLTTADHSYTSSQSN